MNLEDFLEHYGVKGMKWGVRNADRGAGISEDASVAGAALKKSKTQGIDSLSNKELQAVIQRMNLEQQYSKLNPSGTTKAINFVGSLLGLGTTVNQTIAFVNSPAGKALVNTIKSGLNRG